MKRCASGFALPFLALCSQAHGQDGQPSSDFRSVVGAQAQDVSGTALMLGAYAIAVVVFAAYIVRLHLIQRRVASETARLASAMSDDRSRGI